MELGFTSMNTPEDPHPGDLGRMLEEAGFTSLWIGEHPQIPVSRRTPYPAGGDMPPAYRRMMDPFVSLAAAAAAAPSLRIGTGVALPLEHDLLVLAKAVSSIDVVTGGRFEFGVGVGWNEEELAVHRPDIPWRRRYGALAECVDALKAIWDNEEAEYHGSFYDFEPVWSEPKPLQKPHPPVLCGMAGRVGVDQTLAWADEWMPMDVGLGDVKKRVSSFREKAAARGRGDVPITMVTWGDPTAETLRSYRDLGVKRAVLGAAREGWHEPGGTAPFIARYAALVDDLAS